MKFMMSLKSLKIVLALSLIVASASAQEAGYVPETGAKPPKFYEDPLGVVSGAIACVVIGVPTCIALGLGENARSDLSFSRPSHVRGFQLAYFPSYILDLSESTAFQRVEMSGYMGNTLIALSHRRGVQEPNYFSSTSYRLAYSFDWRHLRPAFGVGARKNVNARSGDSFEIWLPVFFDPAKFDEPFGVYFETLWVIGSGRLRPEGQLRLEYAITPQISMALGIGYFDDYENAEMELSVGPVFVF